MNYERFTYIYIRALNSCLADENVSITRDVYIKVNKKLDGISVKFPHLQLQPIIYLNHKYMRFLEGYSIEQIVDESVEYLMNISRNAPQIADISYEEAKKNLYCVVINAELNKELLRDVPHENFNDLAVIAKYRAATNVSFIVKNDMCQYLHMTSQEVMEQAHYNTEKQNFECRNLTEAVCDIMKKNELPDEYIKDFISMQEINCPMYVLSNESRDEGAVVLTSKAAMQDAYKRIKEEYSDMNNLYVLTSSRHEVLLVPDSVIENIEDLKEMHIEVQNTELSCSDRLSNNIYMYDGKSKKLSIVDANKLSETEAKVIETTRTHHRKH